MRAIKWAIELRPNCYVKRFDHVMMFDTKKAARAFSAQGKVVKVEISIRTL